MKKLHIAVCAALFAVFVVVVVLSALQIPVSGDKTADDIIYSCLQTGLAAAFVLTAIAFALGRKGIFPPLRGGARALLWCLPCLAVPLANFPFSSLMGGSATITRPDLVPLFALSCILTALFEEFTFRGLFQSLIALKLAKKPYGEICTVLATSALFGVWHIFNLFSGAGIGATALQVGYAFLLGCMLSAIVIRTGNVWTGVVLHALFNFGGLIVQTLGEGAFQDTAFWIATAVCGISVACHIAAYLIRRARLQNAVLAANARGEDEFGDGKN